MRIRWSELYRQLREPVAACTRHGHALEAVEEDAAGRLVPVFRTPAGLARHGGFDLLVGADGRYSRLRALTVTSSQPVAAHSWCRPTRYLRRGSSLPSKACPRAAR